VINDIASFIKSNFPNNSGSGIIYCLSRNNAEEVALELEKCHQISTCYYHSSMKDKREESYLKWRDNKVQVIVATIAFGMGINKSDVRFIIHHSLSKTMEGYYQETGRAGRDGKPAHCILYYRSADLFRLTSFLFGESRKKKHLNSIYEMARFCENKRDCRRVLISKFFGEAFSSDQCKKQCDNCTSPKELVKKDFTSQALCVLNILECLRNERKKATFLQLLSLWRGSQKIISIDSHLTEKRLSREECEKILVHLLLEGLLKEEMVSNRYSVTSYLVASERGISLLRKGELSFAFEVEVSLRKCANKIFSPLEFITDKISPLSREQVDIGLEFLD